jgi:hypothetical protein
MAKAVQTPRGGYNPLPLPLVFFKLNRQTIINPTDPLLINVKNIKALKRLIPILLAALLLNGCLKEDAWCPEIYLSFAMEDEFLEGDYDSRIQNDVLIYIFKDDKVVYSETIPYEKVAGGTRYAIRKTPEMLGDTKLVAWAVKRDETHVGSAETLTVHHSDRHPEYSMDDDYNDLYLTHSTLASRSPGGETQYAPHHHERYLGTHDPLNDEVWDSHSRYDMILHPAPGRVVVNVKDSGGMLGSQAHVVVDGGMSHMKLGDPDQGRAGRDGYGQKTHVRSDIGPISGATRAAEGMTHTTDVIGVLPSLENSSLSVHIMNGDQLVKTLTISTENTQGNFTALHSGDYIVFDYDLQSAEVAITINGFEIKEVTTPL